MANIGTLPIFSESGTMLQYIHDVMALFPIDMGTASKLVGFFSSPASGVALASGKRNGLERSMSKSTGTCYRTSFLLYIYIDYIYIYICQNDLDSTPWHPSFEPPYSNPGKVFW